MGLKAIFDQCIVVSSLEDTDERYQQEADQLDKLIDQVIDHNELSLQNC